MPVLTAAVLSETAELSAEEFGAFTRLTNHMWARGGRLPDVPGSLARLAGVDAAQWARVWASIGHLFVSAQGEITRPVLSEALDKAKALLAANQARSAAMVAKRWPGRGPGEGSNGTGGGGGGGGISPATASRERQRETGRLRGQRLRDARALGTHTEEQWEALAAEFDGRCVRCGNHPPQALDKDHIVPLYQGGSDAIENIQPLCPRCNSSKGPDSTDYAAFRRRYGWDPNRDGVTTVCPRDDDGMATESSGENDGGFGGSVSSSDLALCLSGSATQALVASEKHTREPSAASAIRAVFEHYRRHHPRAHPKPLATSPEWRKVAARLREGHTVADLCQAIDGYHVSPFHLGENDRNTVYLDIGLLLRDADHVAAGIRFAEKGPPPVISQRTMRNMRAVQSCIADHNTAPERPAWLTPITVDSH